MLTGTGIALVTPFKNGNIDFQGLENLINHCINGGVEYLVSLGTTGESVTLSEEEKNEIFQFTKKTNNGRVKLVAGFGGNNTAKLCKILETFDHKGFDAILSVSPYYNKPTQQGIIQHYKTVSHASPLPIILYNVPGRTGSNMLAQTTLQLANECENIVAIKEASANFDQCMQLLKNKPSNFTVISGDDTLTLPFMSLGMQGVISVVGNAYPSHMSNMVRHCLQGNYAEALVLHNQLLDITNNLFAEGNPAGIKEVLQHLGICSNELRLPLVNVSNALSATLKNQMM